MGGVGASEVLPLQKVGAEKRGKKREGGGTKCFVVVLTRVLEVLTILEGGHKRFPPLKCFFFCVERGCKKFQTRDFPILYPLPLSVINDQALSLWEVRGNLYNRDTTRGN